MISKQLFAGIDLGTSGCRIIFIDSAKSIYGSHTIEYSENTAQTPQLWWQSTNQLLAELPTAIKQRIVAIAIDGTSGSILLTDRQGRPTSSTLMYDDLRAVQEAKIIKQVLPLDNGGQGVSGSLARLLWLLKHETRSEHAHALHQADYILGKMANKFGLSDENNCLKLGYDIVNRRWPESAFSALGIDSSLLPSVHRVGEAVSTIDVSFAGSVGLPTNVQLVAGTTDSIAAFVATGANSSGQAVTSLGSTLVIKQISDKPLFAPEYGIYSHRFTSDGEDKWLVGGASNSGGNVLKHFFTIAEMAAMSSKLEPDVATGLDYYPLLKRGERFPIADPNKAAKLTPRPDNDAIFFQGMLEGIATIEQQAYQKLQALGATPIQSVYSVGGGHKNLAWTTIRKNRLNVAMLEPQQTEAAFGSALIAMRGFNRL